MDETLFGEEVKEPETMDLVVKEFNLGTLATNAENIRATVRHKLEYYKNKTYTEDEIQIAKDDRATLNKSATTLNAAKIELKKKWLKPFEDNFENIIDEATKDIKVVSATVDLGIKAQEDKDRLDKKLSIESFFTAQSFDVFQLSQIFNPAWLNKTFKMKDVEAEILARIEKTKSDLALLDRLGEPDAKAHYLGTLNLESAVAEADRIKANRERLAAIETARLEKEAARLAEVAKPEPIPETETRISFQSPVSSPVETEKCTETVQKPSIVPIQFYERTFRVKTTKEKIIALGEYMTAQGIEYEKI